MTKRLDTLYKTIGKRLYNARTKKGWSQEALSAESGVASAHIGFIEQGRRRPTVSTLDKLTEALDMTLEKLFEGL